MKDGKLTFRLARRGDFDEIVKLSEGIYSGHDYLPLKFHEWLQRKNLAVFLAYSGDRLVGLQASFVVDDGKTLIGRAGRVLPKFRGQGLGRKLEQFIKEYIEEHFPSVLRQRSTTSFGNIGRKERKLLLELDILGYEVEKKLCGKAEISTARKSTEIELCSKQYFSDVVLSLPVVAKIFPDNVIIVNWCPFSPLRSNIDYVLQESDVIYVEQCASDALPRSLSFGTLSPRVKTVQWLSCVYTNDPTLFEAHLLRQFKCAIAQRGFCFSMFSRQTLDSSRKKRDGGTATTAESL